MKIRHLLLAAQFAMLAANTTAQTPAADPMKAPLAKLADCAKLALGSPEARKCFTDLEAMRASGAQAVKTADAAAKPAAAPAADKPPRTLLLINKLSPADKTKFNDALAEFVKQQSVLRRMTPPAAAGPLAGKLDPASMDANAMMAELTAQRTQSIDEQLKAQIAAMKDRNSSIAKLYDLKGELSQIQGSLSRPNSRPDPGALAAYQQARKEAGFTGGGAIRSTADVEQQASMLREQLDAAVSEQQSEMTQLQSMHVARDAAYQTLMTMLVAMQKPAAPPAPK